MTRKFNSRVICEHCGLSTTAESAFERWMRNCPDLDSAKYGIVRFDLDLLLHRYKFATDKRGDRTIQCMMFIEIKTRGADVSPAQRDTLSLFSQVLRNRRSNINAARRGKHANERTAPCRAFSWLNNADTALWLVGAHLLQLSGTDPVNSKTIIWDWRHVIDLDLLTRLLRFEVDPDTLATIDWRRRYSNFDPAKRWPLFGSNGFGQPSTVPGRPVKDGATSADT